MKWLSDNYKWLFDGVAGAALVAFIVYLIQRLSKSSSTQSAGQQTAVLNSEASSVGNSPVAGGSGINQNVNAPTINVNIGQPAPATRPQAEQPPPSKIQKTLPNVQYIGAETVSIREEMSRGLVEGGFEQNAIIIRFANEARPSAQNLRARVRAVLIYRYGQKEVDIAGSWLYEDSDVSEFEPDGRRHKLIAGIMIDGEFAAITAKTFQAHRRTWYKSDSLPLKGFQTGSVFVQLTDVQTHDVLYENEFAVRVNPLSIASLDPVGGRRL